jgi:3-phenylpropionate/trans-cinnamate dioxygenase ferredoxin subunit
MRVKVASSEQLKPEEPLGVKTGDRNILLVRSEGKLYATENECPHLDQPLDDGKVKNGKITCRHHGVQVLLDSGKISFSMGLLNLKPIQTFEVTEEDGEVFVELPG